ncbi:MAG TPA: gamma-glutamylcyclotransferase family protein [Acidimicrobiales bacterium]
MRVFVYGTLMPGELRWPALERFSVGWERATARGRMWDSGHGYPAVRFDAGGAAIPGVVVTLAPDRLAEAVATLDAIEGEGSLYRRIEIVTSAGSATTYEWLGTTDGLAVLEDGWPVG